MFEGRYQLGSCPLIEIVSVVFAIHENGAKAGAQLRTEKILRRLLRFDSPSGYSLEIVPRRTIFGEWDGPGNLCWKTVVFIGMSLH
jgi:hypothetical protein